MITQGSFILSNVRTEIIGGISHINESSEIKNENDLLKRKLEQLEYESQKLEAYKREEIELTKLLAFKKQLKGYKFLGANIIDIDVKNGFSITIDRGRNDNINVNDPVISSDGLVGRVSSVRINSSQVLCIIDPDCTVIASTKMLDCIVKGNLDSNKKNICKVEFLAPEVDVNYGDKIITSRTSNIFPEDIPIGEIVEVRKSDTGINYCATIKTSVDFNSLDIVAVLTAQ
jgi:rod shape-determining protein MreC